MHRTRVTAVANGSWALSITFMTIAESFVYAKFAAESPQSCSLVDICSQPDQVGFCLILLSVGVILGVCVPTTPASERTMPSETTLQLSDMSMHIGDMRVHLEQV
jgi:hypothetical protein